MVSLAGLDASDLRGEARQTVEAGAAHSSPAGRPHPDAAAGVDMAALERWRLLWLAPLGLGAGLVIVAGSLISWAQRLGWPGFWYGAAGLLLLGGLLLAAIALLSRTAHWLHLRIEQPEGNLPQSIEFGLPLPIRPAIWFFRLFRPRLTVSKDLPGNPVQVAALLEAVESSTSSETPISLELVEAADGARVQIQII